MMCNRLSGSLGEESGGGGGGALPRVYVANLQIAQVSVRHATREYLRGQKQRSFVREPAIY